jgi:hypothetical protein
MTAVGVKIEFQLMYPGLMKIDIQVPGGPSARLRHLLGWCDRTTARSNPSTYVVRQNALSLSSIIGCE